MTTVKLTSQLLHDASTQGYHGFTRAQIEALGVSYPPKKGWLRGLVGKEVQAEVYERFKAAAKITAKLTRPTTPKPRVIQSMEFTDDAGNAMLHVQIDITAKDEAKLMNFLRNQ